MMQISQNRITAVILTLSVILLPSVQTTINAKEKIKLTDPNHPVRWEKDIQKFELQDKQNPKIKNVILFIGGSNFRRWDLKINFPDLPVINRGFGGSMISDANYYLDRIVFPYQPKTIVLYGGANDMGRGHKTPRQVLKDYEEFVKRVHEKLPKTNIIYMSLPHFFRSRNNSDEIAKVNRVNELISEVTLKDARLEYVEINKAMAGQNGVPRKELFIKDGIHMSPAGYQIWAERLMPMLMKK
jgi:lysophospholipase L1-like esterase